MAAPVVGVVGAKALRKDLARLATDVSGPLYKAMTAAGKAAVAPIVPATQGALPHDSGALAGSVRASGTRTGGAVRMGRATVPYAGWIDFGGSRPDGSERPYNAGGRYLFPAAQADAERASRAYSDALSAIFASSGVWTNTTDNGGQVHD